MMGCSVCDVVDVVFAAVVDVDGDDGDDFGRSEETDQEGVDKIFEILARDAICAGVRDWGVADVE